MLGKHEVCYSFVKKKFTHINYHSSRDILGQQVLYLKICTCPKRDRNQDERHLESNKNKLFFDASEEEELDATCAKKKCRRTMKNEVKDENEINDSSDVHPVPADWEVSRAIDGDYRLVIKFSNKDLLLRSIEGIIEKTAVAMIRNPQHLKLRQQTNYLLNLKSKHYTI